MRSSRRSDMAAIWATATARPSSAMARAAATAWASEATTGASGVPDTIGLSVTDASSRSTTSAAAAQASRAAPCTCGTARRLSASWVSALRPSIDRPGEPGPQRLARRLEAGRDPDGEHLRGEGRGPGPERVERQGRDAVRRGEQPLDAGEGHAGETGGAGSAVDEAQAFLGHQHDGPLPDSRQCRRAVQRPATGPRASLADQHEADMRHMGEVADGAARRDLRYAALRQQAEEGLHDQRPHARAAVGVIVDLRRDHGPHFGFAEALADAGRMAHQEVARQLRLLRPRHHGFGQGSDAGIDPVGAKPAFGDGLRDARRLFDRDPAARATRRGPSPRRCPTLHASRGKMRAGPGAWA